jgi:hypothetical protein
MSRLVCALMLAMALFVVPAGVTLQSSGQAQAETAVKTDDGTEAKKKKARKKTEKKAAKKKERTEKQKAAAERMKRCGAEYQDTKKAGKLAKGETWNKFRKGCLARLQKAG